MKEIYSRRSIRKYKDEKVSDTDLTSLAKAVMNTPSGMNTQPWQIVIINDPDLIGELVSYNKGWTPLEKAGRGMLLCGDLTKNPDPNYLNIDIGAATQTVLLEAESMGLGTCWLGVGPRAERTAAVSSMFSLPENFHPVSMIAVGIKDEQPEMNDRFLEERVHFNSFGK